VVDTAAKTGVSELTVKQRVVFMVVVSFPGGPVGAPTSALGGRRQVNSVRQENDALMARSR
jgi:hypothetical protein